MQQQQIGAIGIDFGSSRSVIAVAKRGGVEIIANEASLRETRNIVGYGEKQRFMGESGNAQAKSNFKNTISNFNRLLGLPSSYPFLKNETRQISSKLTVNPQGKLVHEVQYQNETVNLLPEQVTAAMLGQLRKIISLNNLPNHEAVISVPSYYTEQERKSLRDACQIAGLIPQRLFNESSAISLSYGLFRKSELDSTTPRNVAFVDLGHSKFSAFVSSFTKEKLQVLAQVHERQLGARDMDWLILEHYARKFEEKNGISIKESKKGILRLLDSIQKQRQVLSANSEAECNCEYIIEDLDLNEHLTRQEFEEIIKPILQQIQDILQTLVQEIKNKKIQVHSVEIIGGASRIPIVQEIIKRAFQVQQLNKTLNASECIARGCALMAAMISPQFRVSEYQLEEQNYYNIRAQWNFIGNDQETAPKSQILFEKGCSLPNIKSITFNKAEGINLQLFYENAPPGFSSELASYKIVPSKPKESSFQVKIKLKLDKNGLLSLEESQLVEDYQVEEKIPVKKDNNVQSQKQENKTPSASQEQANNNNKQSNENNQPTPQQQENLQQYETKVRKKTRYTNIPSEEIQRLYQLDKSELDRYIQLQNQQVENDEYVVNTLFKKNELESFIYTWKSLLSGQYQQYEQKQKINEILQMLQENENWLNENCQDLNLNNFIQKLQDIQRICNPIQIRYNQYINLPENISQIKNLIAQCENFVNSQDIQYSHISQQERKAVFDEVQKIKNWLDLSERNQRNIQTYQDPAITCEEIQKNKQQLFNVYESIVKKPKPSASEQKYEDKMQTENVPNEELEQNMDIE